eukprot:c22223_g2_i1 orf=914-1480(-)
MTFFDKVVQFSQLSNNKLELAEFAMELAGVSVSTYQLSVLACFHWEWNIMLQDKTMNYMQNKCELSRFQFYGKLAKGSQITNERVLLNKIATNSLIIIRSMWCCHTSRIERVFTCTTMPIHRNFATSWRVHCTPFINAFKFSFCFTSEVGSMVLASTRMVLQGIKLLLAVATCLQTLIRVLSFDFSTY